MYRLFLSIYDYLGTKKSILSKETINFATKLKNMDESRRRWLFIVNPAAGNGQTARRWPHIAALLKQKLPAMDVVFTQGRGHAPQLVEAALAQGYRCIAAVGGDGTNHEVINGLMQQQIAPLDDIVYTLLPVGTGNDWIRTHGIPRRLDEWIEMVNDGQLISQDIGVIEYQNMDRLQKRYFANVAGMAYDGFVVRFAERNKHLIAGRLMYLALILLGLFRYKLSKAEVRFDGQETTDFFYTINGGICRYSGGGMQLVPHANPNDGLLALTLARKLTKTGVLLNTWRFYNASIGSHPKVSLYQVKRIEVVSADGSPVWVEADGEFLGVAPAILYIADAKLRVLVPK